MELVRILGIVFAGVGGSAAILLAAAWMLRTALNSWLTKDVKRFELNLQAASDREIESLKHSFALIAKEHEVRFSKMHQRRAEVIEELYKKLTLLNLHGEQFSLTSENNRTDYQAERFTQMQEEFREVFLYAEQHRIFLPEKVCALVDKHLVQLRKTVWAAAIFGRIEYPNEHTTQQSNQAFTKVYKDFETDIPAARSLLEAEFRGMLGAEPS